MEFLYFNYTELPKTNAGKYSLTASSVDKISDIYVKSFFKGEVDLSLKDQYAVAMALLP